MSRALAPLLVAGVAALLPLACAGGAPAAPAPSAPTTTVTAASTPNPTAVSSSLASASAVPSTSTSASSAATDACRGGAFDLETLPDGCKSTKPGTDIEAFAVRLVPDQPDIHGGDTLGVILEMTNTSSADADLVFVASCASFSLTAWRNGKRADYINAACGYGGGCGGIKMRLTVVPNGKVIKHLSIRTVVRKERPGCDGADDAGAFSPGVYELRADGLGSFPLMSAIRSARASITVKK